MKDKTIKSKGKAGHHRSDIRKFSVEEIEIDNYFERKIYYKKYFFSKKKLIETIAEKRILPDKVKPPKIVPSPAPKAKLLLIDHTNPFWKLSPDLQRDITCWVAHTVKGETFLYDAVTGKKVGEGIPPPTERAISLSGFHKEDWQDPWINYRKNAAYWFTNWGFSTWSAFAPSKSDHGAAIRNGEYNYRYAIAHGNQYRFQTRKNLWITASDISKWMSGGGGGPPVERPDSGRAPMWFAFLGHCWGMVSTGSGTLSYAFRKGQLKDTVTIGYYKAEESSGWKYSLYWQKKLFSKVNTGVTWKEAYDYAVTCYPECKSMVRFVGDENMKIKPEGGEKNMSLNIQSDPSGKKIIVDGENVGTTPKIISVTCIDHTIQVNCRDGGNGGGSDLPDLIITNTWMKWLFTRGIYFKEKNIGSGIAKAHRTSVSGQGKVNIPVLNPGEERTFFIRFTRPAGLHWTVCADCDNEVQESDKSNNCLIK